MSRNSHIADKVRSIMAKRRMGTGKLGNVVAGKPKASGRDNKKVPMASKEYVLPADFVEKVGPDNIDQAVMQTLGSLQPPSGSAKRGYRRGGRGEGHRGNGMMSSWEDYFGRGLGRHFPANFGAGWMKPDVGFDPNIEPTPIPQQPDYDNDQPSTSAGGPPERNASREERLEVKELLGPQSGQWATSTFGVNPWLTGGFPGGLGYAPPLSGPNPNGGFTAIPAYWNPQGYPFAQPATADVSKVLSLHSGRRKTK